MIRQPNRLLVRGQGGAKPACREDVGEAIENSRHRVLDAIYREDHHQTRGRNSAASHSILRRMALNAHNRMPSEGKKRESLPKCELRASQHADCREKLLSLM